MIKKYSILSIFTLLFIQFGFSQKKTSEKPDIKRNVIGISATYAYQIPTGDLANRFGANSNIGASVWFKHKTNWIIGAEFTYMFGQNMKEEAYSIFNNIKTAEGNITDKYGQASVVLLSERGFYAGIKLGRVISISKRNLNSGILLTFGLGILQHKIDIQNDGNVTPQIIGDYEKGYDKLTNGLALQQFVGYMYVGKSRLANFYVGMEFTQAFTQSRRDFDFALMKKDDTKRLDLLNSIRVGWVIPFYKREAKNFYYN